VKKALANPEPSTHGPSSGLGKFAIPALRSYSAALRR
jgi:hypothetical protein